MGTAVEKVHQSEFLMTNIDRSDEESGWSSTTSRGGGSYTIRSLSRSRTGLLLAAVCGFLLCFLCDRWILPLDSDALPISLTKTPTTPTTILEKPKDRKVVGFVFYGRRMFVSILDCHLRKNLVVNGGYLDEVHFIANTEDKADLAYLDELVAEVPEYVRWNQATKTSNGWTDLWIHANDFEENTILIKIDDDVVYIHDNAIPRLVHSLLTHPTSFAIAANLINNPQSHFWQYHSDTLLPFLPENLALNPQTSRVPSWRPSLLPPHPASDITTLSPSDLALYPPYFNWTAHAQPLHALHRWLPLPNTPRNLLRTPAFNASWPEPRSGATMFGYASEIHSWSMAAQVHMSFLTHLEASLTPSSSSSSSSSSSAPSSSSSTTPATNTLTQKYLTPLGAADGLWNMQYERYSINFLAILAGKIGKATMAYNDEVAITMMLPEGRGEPFYVDSQALVSHFSFGTQREIGATDILGRYLSFANERVCGRGNLKQWFSAWD